MNAELPRRVVASVLNLFVGTDFNRLRIGCQGIGCLGSIGLGRCCDVADGYVVLFALADKTGEDFSAHNESSGELWQAFEKREHKRPPVRFNTNPRILLLDPAYNTRGITFESYMLDPEVMAQVQLEWQYWVRFYLPGDHTKGLPDSWLVYVDFQNFYDAAWFGCPVVYRADQVPDTVPILSDFNKRMLFDKGVPDPFAGEWAERALRYVDFFKGKQDKGWTFLGRPVVFGGHVSFLSADGVFTVAASLRGATELCTDLLADPEYVRELLVFITESLVKRSKAWRKFLNMPDREDGFWAADDAIELISLEAYEEFVLPRHVEYYGALATEKDRGMHLCGDAQRHFGRIRERLGVSQFDTGFPVDFGELRRTLGTEVLVCGGPRVPLFLEEDSRSIADETRRILASGILEGGRFILQEGNNLAPRSRLENCETVCRIAKETRLLS